MLKPETLLLLLRIGSPSDLPSTLFHAGTIALLARRIWAAPIDARVLGAVDQRFCPPAWQPRSPWSSGLRQAHDDLIVIHLFTTSSSISFLCYFSRLPFTLYSLSSTFSAPYPLTSETILALSGPTHLHSVA